MKSRMGCKSHLAVLKYSPPHCGHTVKLIHNVILIHSSEAAKHHLIVPVCLCNRMNGITVLNLEYPDWPLRREVSEQFTALQIECHYVPCSKVIPNNCLRSIRCRFIRRIVCNHPLYPYACSQNFESASSLYPGAMTPIGLSMPVNKTGSGLIADSQLKAIKSP